MSAARTNAARRSLSLRTIAPPPPRGDSRSSPSPPTFPARVTVVTVVTVPLPSGSPVRSSASLLGVSAATGIDRPTSRFRQSSSYRLGSSPRVVRDVASFTSTTTTVLVPRRLLTPARVGSLKPSYAKSAHLTNDPAALRLAVLTRTGTPIAWYPSAHRRSLSLTPDPLRAGSTHSLSTCAFVNEPPGLATRSSINRSSINRLSIERAGSVNSSPARSSPSPASPSSPSPSSSASYAEKATNPAGWRLAPTRASKHSECGPGGSGT